MFYSPLKVPMADEINRGDFVRKTPSPGTVETSEKCSSRKHNITNLSSPDCRYRLIKVYFLNCVRKILTTSVPGPVLNFKI